jgi:uroporphyrinogen decarboxylase
VDTKPEARSATDTKPLMDVLRGNVAAAPPVWLMRQAGRYLPEYRALRRQASSFLDFCYTPEMAVEATLQPIERFGLDAAILFSDILVIPDALGMPVRFVEGTGPVLEPVSDAAGIDALKPASAAPEHLAPVYAALRTLRDALDPAVTLIGFAGAPWTIATYMVEGRGGHNFETVKQMMWQAPAAFTQLIDLLAEAVARHLIAQIDAGADCVKLFDSWAGVLPEPEFNALVIDPTRRIVEQVRAAHPGVPVIGFPRQAGDRYAAYAAGTAVDAVAVDQGVTLATMQALSETVAVQGNLDPQLLVAGGAPMVERIRSLVDGMAGRRHVFNLGHGVVPQTPPEHVAELVAAVRGSA